jgi:hypothetical protein
MRQINGITIISDFFIETRAYDWNGPFNKIQHNLRINYNIKIIRKMLKQRIISGKEKKRKEKKRKNPRILTS